MATGAQNELASSALTSAYSLIGLQLVSRLFTFFLNQALFRLASPRAFGTAAIQFELLLSTILFLSREGVRNALLRKRIGVANNLSFFPVLVGVPLALVTTLAYTRYAATETTIQPGFYAATAVYAVAAVLELWSEPMHNRYVIETSTTKSFWSIHRAMSELKTNVRVRAEGTGVVCRTLVTLAVFVYEGMTETAEGELALLAFAIGQLSYSLCVLLVYLKHFGGHSLFPASPLFRRVFSMCSLVCS